MKGIIRTDFDSGISPVAGCYAASMNPTQPGSASPQLCKPQGIDRDIAKQSEVKPTVADLQTEHNPRDSRTKLRIRGKRPVRPVLQGVLA